MATKTAIVTSDNSFVLPAGATIKSIGYNGTMVLSSSCENLLSSAPVEEFVCYGFVLIAHESSNSGAEAFEGDSIRYTGVMIDGVKHDFPEPVPFEFTGPGEEVSLALKALPATKDLLTNYSACPSNNDGNDSKKYYVMFKTIPSIGDNMYLMAISDTPNYSSDSTPFIASTPFLVPCQTRTAITAAGNDACDCSVNP